MKIEKIAIHNFRSIKDQTFNLIDYSLLIGANNSGKTNIIDAIRLFYEKDIKFIQNRDFPKFNINDQESWIEIKFELDDGEYANLRDEYKLKQNIFTVRKYLKSTERDRVRSNQSNIYAYEKNGKLSNHLFYGAKAVSEGKLGDVLYIPEVTKIDEFTKLSGPSVFRDSLNFVVKKVIKKSPSFDSLKDSFSDFNRHFKSEVSEGGISLQNFIDDVNKEINDWNVSFGIDINEIRPEEIIKNLISHYLEEKHLNNQRMDISNFGQGLQRHLIYTLIKLSAKYKEQPIEKERKEFSPNYSLILFEEPEAFLHPAQQEILNQTLRELASEEGQQVLVSTHSPHFVSKNIDDIVSLLKLSKEGSTTSIYQADEIVLDEILKENKELKIILGGKPKKIDLELESIRYSLWLDADRSCSFFADIALICEGLTEKAIIDCLVKEKKLDFGKKRVYVLNSAGKWDIHRYMNLFGGLGIRHSVLFDKDKPIRINEKLNSFIEKNKNKFTIGIHSFDGEFEDFLEIAKETDRYKKPLNVMWHYRNGQIKKEKIEEFINIIENLIN